MNNWKESFFRSLVSESDGTGSTISVSILALTSFIIRAGTTLLVKLHAPISVTDLNSFLTAGSAFMVTTCGPLYLINKGASVVNARTQCDCAAKAAAPVEEK